jgi:hypothetical protein
MYRSLFIDRFDGTLEVKTMGQFELYHLWKALEDHNEFRYNEKLKTQELHIPSDLIDNYVANLDFSRFKMFDLKEARKNILDSFNSVVKLAHVFSIKRYIKDPSHNYIFSAPLVNTLKRTKANVSLSVLPEEPFCFYMEMEDLFEVDGTKIEGILISKNNLENGNRNLELVIYAPLTSKCVDSYVDFFLNTDGNDWNDEARENFKNGWLSEEARYSLDKGCPITVKSISIPYHMDNSHEKIEDAVDRAEEDYGRGQYETASIRGVKIAAKIKQRINEDRAFKTILNGLLYILSGEEHLDFEKNEFSKKKSKYEAQSKIYTPKQFIHLGKNVKFLREYAQDGYFWAPFFRKKANSSDGKKTVFVKGHFKYFKNKEKYA